MPGPGVTETHISTLFFTDDRVYKLAKRVDLPFLCTTETEERLRLATREYELNKRFAPDVYLGLADVVENGHTVDRMLVMQRMDHSTQLAHLLSTSDSHEYLKQVARTVATAHADAPIADALTTSPARLAANWHDNFAAIEPHIGSIVNRDDFERVRYLAGRYLGVSHRLRVHRLEHGFVRDGHGDLTAEDIYCLPDGPRILDCLAFDDELRIDDVLNDIAFLAMDVHRLRGAAAAQDLMSAYHEFSNEQHPSSLAHHYVAYRAHVRAKIACLRAAQGHQPSESLARTYHALALHHLERAQLRLIVVGGGPGVGKTAVAQRLADHFGYFRVATDELRHDVTGRPHGTHAFEAPDAGVYSPEMVDKTYAELNRQARALLVGGYGVVLDASWASATHRAGLRESISDIDIDVIEIELEVDDSIARQRITHRLTHDDDPSDATPGLVDVMAARRDPWPEATVLDTTDPIETIVGRATAKIDSTR